jgi:hypothetical protein
MFLRPAQEIVRQAKSGGEHGRGVNKKVSPLQNGLQTHAMGG